VLCDQLQILIWRLVICGGALVGRVICFDLYFSTIFLIIVWGIDWRREITPRESHSIFALTSVVNEDLK